MKRVELLKAAPLGLLAACGGNAGLLGGGAAASRLFLPQSRVHPGDCTKSVIANQWGVTANFDCGSGFWSTAHVDFDPKEGTVADYAKAQWCKNPQTACPYPNTVNWYFPWADNPNWDWLEKQLIDIWKGYQAMPGTKSGSIYNSGVLVATGTVDVNKMVLHYTAYDSTTGGQETDIDFSLPQGTTTSGSKIRPDDCTVDDLNCLACLGAFIGAAFTAETGIGALIAVAAYLGLGASAIQAKRDGCFNR